MSRAVVDEIIRDGDRILGEIIRDGDRVLAWTEEEREQARIAIVGARASAGRYAAEADALADIEAASDESEDED